MKTQKIMYVNDVPGRLCSNSKFMHIVGLPGMNVVTSHDIYSNEEITSVYKGEELMAERIVECGHKGSVSCFLFGYRKDLEIA